MWKTVDSVQITPPRYLRKWSRGTLAQFNTFIVYGFPKNQATNVQGNPKSPNLKLSVPNVYSALKYNFID